MSSDDIVTNLRTEADAHADGDWNDHVIRRRFAEAADAIEARDAEILLLRAAGDALVDAVERQQWSTVDVAIAVWREACRG